MDVFDVTSLFKPNRSGFAFPLSPIAASISALFSRDYSAGTLGANATFARSSSATIIDHEGVIRTVPSGAARFNGLRYVRNLYTKTEDFSYAGWTKTLCTVASGYTDPDGGSTAWRITSTGSGTVILKGFNISLADGTELLNSWWVRRVTGSGNVLLYTGGGTATTGISPTSSWQRFVANKGTTTSGTDVIGILITGATASDVIEVWHPQYEDVTGRADTATPSEYVSVGVESSPYHGANVDGIKYFATENGNSVVSNVVTEGTGAAIAGGYLLMEPAATNLVTVSTPTDAFWYYKVQCTITDNAAIGPFGKNDAALYTVIGTGDNYAQRELGATYSSGVTYTFTHYAKAGTLSWFIGAAPHGVVPDANRFVWFDVSNGIIGTQQSNIVSASIEKVGDWYRCRFSITATSTGSSSPGYLNAVDGNNSFEVASGVGTMYFGHVQVEANSTGTSEILTSGSAVTRAAESLSYSGIAADNETRAITDAGTVDVDDWDGIVDATINGADNLAQITSIDVYTTGERPA